MRFLFGTVSVVVQLDKERISHDFVVVDKLIIPMILGVDFLWGNGLTLDFSSTPQGRKSQLSSSGLHFSIGKDVSGTTLAPSSTK